MLSDHERATLREIQRQVLAEDPRFVQIFDARAQRLSRAPRESLDEYRWLYTVLMWIATAMSVLWVVAGSLGGALLIAVLALTLFLARRRHGTTPTSRT